MRGLLNCFCLLLLAKTTCSRILKLRSFCSQPAAVEVGENQGAVGGDGQTAGLYNSMRQLMEAMRNLLSNIQPTPAPIEGQNNSDTDDWDEDEDDNVRDFGLD